MRCTSFRAIFIAYTIADLVFGLQENTPADPSDTVVMRHKYADLHSVQTQNSPYPACPRGRYATQLLTRDGCLPCPKGKFGRAAPPLKGSEGDFCRQCPPGERGPGSCLTASRPPSRRSRIATTSHYVRPPLQDASATRRALWTRAIVRSAR